MLKLKQELQSQLDIEYLKPLQIQIVGKDDITAQTN